MRFSLKVGALIYFGFLSVGSVFADGAPADNSSPGVSAPTPPEPTSAVWQTRRAHTAQLLRDAKAGDIQSRSAVDAVLTQFESSPLKFTPLENLDILGAYYVPREGVEKALSIIVMNQVLGWYDALRFGTESGRAEIVQNEGFFKRPFIIAGADSIKQMTALMKEHPDQVKDAVQQGIDFATKSKDSHPYDSHWPEAYGLERIACAQGGKCVSPPVLPQDQWQVAWQLSKQRVLAYYVPTSSQSQ